MAKKEKTTKPTHGDVSKYSRPPEQRSADAPLTEMQRQFVNNLVHNRMSNTGAARAAGFASPNVVAPRLVKMPKIQQAIAVARQEYAVASGMTKKKVIDGFVEAIDMARIKADPIAMVSGWREIGRLCGFYEPTKSKIEISVNGQVLLQKMQAMSDEELLKMAEEQHEVLDAEFEVVGEGEEEGVLGEDQKNTGSA